MRSESESSSEKSGSATKNAWIAGVGAVVGALLTATATVFAAQIQAGASKPSQSVNPTPFTTSGDQSAEPNAVPNSSSPTPSPSEMPKNKPSASPSPSSIMLKDLISLHGDSWKSVDSQIDGESYPDSTWASTCSASKGSDMTYVISKNYKRFKSTIGIDDFSEQIRSIIFTVIGDGKVIYQKEISSGPPSMIDIPVSGIVRFTIGIGFTISGTDCNYTRAIWANARLEK